MKGLYVVLAFWFLIFVFVIAGYSGSFGVSPITGYAVSDTGAPTFGGIQGMMILVLFFTNLATLFFYIREKTKN